MLFGNFARSRVAIAQVVPPTPVPQTEHGSHLSERGCVDSGEVGREKLKPNSERKVRGNGFGSLRLWGNDTNACP